jgi:hypothetical protein
MDYALQMLQEQRESASKDRAAEIVARVKQLHISELSVGTKVEFVKRFSGNKAYTYLALKVHNEMLGMDLWYVTGKEASLQNEAFENFLAEKLGFESFQRLTLAREDPNADVIKGWAGAITSHAVGPADPGEEL